MEQKIGLCSLCGGDVVGHSGAWAGVTPPPPAHCTRCGAVEDDGVPTIKMRPPASQPPMVGWPYTSNRITFGIDGGC